MKAVLVIAAVLGMLALGSEPAQAGGPRFGITVGFGGGYGCYYPPPVYYYRPAPVYYAPYYSRYYCPPVRYYNGYNRYYYYNRPIVRRVYYSNGYYRRSPYRVYRRSHCW